MDRTAEKMLRKVCWMVVAITILLFAMTTVVGCNTGDDDDDDGVPDGLDPVDDDDMVDDDDDDDSSTTITLLPATEAIPAGTTAGFDALVTYSDSTSELNPEGLVWEIADTTKATVDAGTVTAVANGSTTLTASLEDASSAPGTIFVGPDVFLYDMLTGTFDALDRQSAAFTSDYLAQKGSVAIVANHMFFRDDKAYLTDSGDYGVGITGAEKVVIIDPANKTTEDIALSIDSPWASAYYEGYVYTTGYFSDQLAQIDLETKAVTNIALPTDCVPGPVVGAAGKIYVGCTGFDVDTFTYGNTLAVYDPDAESVSTITLNRDNPSSMAVTADESAVYVICTGDYFTTDGQVDRIDTATDTVVNSFDIGGALGAAAIDPDGKLFILDWKSMYVVDTEDADAILRGEGDPISVGSDDSWLASILIHSDTGEVYVANNDYGTFQNTIEVFDAATYSLITSHDLSATGSSPTGLVSW